MSIRVVAKKVKRGGRKFFRVTEVSALRRDELPEEYLATAPCCWLSGECLNLKDCDSLTIDSEGKIYSPPAPALLVGGMYAKECFEQRMAYLAKCGERLTRMNEWSGEVVVEI